MKTNLKSPYTLLLLAVMMTAGGCKSSETPGIGPALNSLDGMRNEREARMTTAAADAIAQGKSAEALAYYERLYKENAEGFSAPRKAIPEIALNYAQLLRKTGEPEKALEVLAPYAETRAKGRRDKHADTSVDPVILTEFAAINIALGKFDEAEVYLARVLEDKNAANVHPDAFNLMGVVLDAKGMHKEAEQSYRSALENWKGDSTSVMNNLALSLASQGMFKESLITLRQALVKAPEKEEIARNIEVVSELQKSVAPPPPVDIKKKKTKK